MKKIMLLIAFAGMLSYGHCQNVKVNINNQEASTKEDCAYRINGICSTEDIGGVDVQITSEEFVSNYDTYYRIYAVFTNYNKSAVTVLYEMGTTLPDNRAATEDGTTGNIVIQANDSKRVLLDRAGWYSSYVTAYYIKGMIVRKIQ